jgi:UDP-glucuronate decarboxylase
LLGSGHSVICLDNLFTGNKANILHLMENSNFEFIRHDIIDPILLEVDQIFNMACPASPVHYQHNPIKTVKTSVLGVLNMLGLAKRVKARMLQASTSEVYGDPQVHPQREEYWGNVNPFGTRSCYDEGKRVAETLMRDYFVQNGVDIRVARIFNCYGPRMRPDDGRVVSNLIVQSLRGKKLTVYGDGSQTRSFCYANDLVDGLIGLMNCETDGVYSPVNLGNPHEVTVFELAQMVSARLGGEIEFRDLPADDPTRRCPDISRAKRLLGWEPKISLEIGLERTIEYFKQLESSDSGAVGGR